MRVLVTGAQGVLGARVVAGAAGDAEAVLAVSRRSSLPTSSGGVDWIRWDLASEPVPEAVAAWRPSVVIHAAAMTDVDGCELRPEQAYAANVTATERIAELAVATGARLLYVSTDSVFDGRRGKYCDGDLPAPVNAYARTKVAGELVASRVPGALIVRVSFVSGERLSAWILEGAAAGREIPVFTDVVFTPVDVRDLADDLLTLAGTDVTGVVHLASAEPVSKADYAERLVRAAGLGNRARLRRVSVDVVPLQAPRPKDTSLIASPTAMRWLGPRTLENAIRDYAREFVACSRE